MRDKRVSAKEAVALINSGDTLATSGFVGTGTPDALLYALERRFLETEEPKALTLVFAAGQGDGKEQGLNRLGHPGLIKRAIGGHWGLIPKLAKLAIDNQIEAYNLPQGCISHLYRDIAAHTPGSLSKVGLDTFVDPRQQGGKINAMTTEDMVELMLIGGEEWLFYKAFKINVAFIRGTTADQNGNISMEREALTLDNLAMAMAVRNSGGVVIAQVERFAKSGSLHPRQVKIPASLVDCVVLAEPEHHWQTYATPYSAAFAGEIQVDLDSIEVMPLDERKIIARRCAMELPVEGVVNLGIGMPEGVANVANEEKLMDLFTLTAEPGIVGGVPASGLNFGAGYNIQALIDQNQQFDFYDGGGLDMACLGMAEVDAIGNVNVSRFGARLAGAGGFINISQNAGKLVFAGTFTASGLQISAHDGQLHIVSEGRAPKFTSSVQQITFSGRRAASLQQSVLYVTERCVFELGANGLRLIEVAPGIDIERDIVAHMGFRPIIEQPRLMDARIFDAKPMDLRSSLLLSDMAQRVSYHAGKQILFLNLSHLRIKTPADVSNLANAVAGVCQPLGKKVPVVVNYDGFHCDDALQNAYADMVAHLEKQYYSQVSRYASGAFMRMQVGKLFSEHITPPVFSTQQQAEAFVKN